jgi:hypothetical protein
MRWRPRREVGLGGAGKAIVSSYPLNVLRMDGVVWGGNGRGLKFKGWLERDEELAVDRSISVL